MGNCCTNSPAEGNADSEVAMRISHREKNEATTDILNPPESGQGLDSALLTDFSSPSKQEPPSQPASLFTETDVEHLQATIRTYLSKKSATSRVGDMFDWKEPTDLSSESALETNIDPIGNLSAPARQIIGRKNRFVFEKDVRGVVSSNARLLSDGSIYIGQWSTQNCALYQRKGKGRLYSSNGSFSEGYWLCNELTYKARHVAQNGDFYEGGFLNGKKEGLGDYETFDGRMKYSGHWEQDKRHGYGVEVYSDGARYEGDFFNDEKTGKGQITYEDGSVYKGEFLAGEFNGHGEYSWADGRHYKGSWKKSKMDGKGLFTYKDGKWYEGEYVHDKKEGYGVYFWDSKTYEGEWKAGKMHGVGWLTNEKGKRKFQFHEGNRGNEIKV